MIKEIDVLSRVKAIEYSYKKDIPDSIIISISEPYSKCPYFDKNNEHIKDVLPLFFDDILEEESKHFPDLTPMNMSHVEAIKAFLDKHKETDYTLIVHCYAGISRSSATAAACALYLGLSDDFVWDSCYFCPNEFVFKLLNEGLNLGITKEEIDAKFQRSIDSYDVHFNSIE